MSFWKEPFGVKEPPKADMAERESTQRSAASNAQPPSIQPIPATPPQPTIPSAHSVAAPEQSASFHDAVKGGDLGRVKALLKDHADLVFSKANNFGATPLYWAAMNGHKDVAELLLTNKAEVNAKDNLGWTPLHCAAVKGQKDVTELLLAHGAEVNAKNNHGWTPLHWAAFGGHKDVADLLLANQAEVNAKDNNGETPLHLAVIKAHKDVVELLRQRGGHE